MADSCSRERPRVNSGDRGFAQCSKGKAMEYKHAQKGGEIFLQCPKPLI
jgi:hypothetical protein